jgi:hypothetical protein
MQPISYARHQFPPEIIRHAIWLYLRFTLSYRDVEECLAERGLDGSVALTWNGYNKPGRCGHSCGKTEELAHKMDFTWHTGLR